MHPPQSSTGIDSKMDERPTAADVDLRWKEVNRDVGHIDPRTSGLEDNSFAACSGGAGISVLRTPSDHRAGYICPSSTSLVQLATTHLPSLVERQSLIRRKFILTPAAHRFDLPPAFAALMSSARELRDNTRSLS